MAPGLYDENWNLLCKWENIEIVKVFRGKKLQIDIHNPGHAESGCKKMIVNGTVMPGNYVPEDMLTDITQIEYYLS